MAERVGFSKTIEAEWLHQAAELSIQGFARKEAGELLNDLIRQKITNETNIKQSRIILLRTWFDNDPVILDRAKTIYNAVSPTDRMAIHWSLLLAQYSIFDDLCDVIGNLFSFRDEITLKQIRDRIYDLRGESGTLISSLSKNITTMKNLNALAAVDKPGVYVKKENILCNCQVIGLLLTAILFSREQKYISWPDFVSHPAIFPFTFHGVDESQMAALPYVLPNCFDGHIVFGTC